MRTSQYLFSTLKETPAEAAIVSHQLMLRAGMIRPLASGLYNWMPTGWRVLRKVEKSSVKKWIKAAHLKSKCQSATSRIMGRIRSLGTIWPRITSVLKIVVIVTLY